MSEHSDSKIHAWHIDEREYGRHEQRRGRRHAFEEIEPERTALVVIDMVPFFVAELEYCRGIVPNIGRLASSLRVVGGTVAWVLPGPSERPALDVEFYGPEVAEMYGRAGGAGPLQDRLWGEFEVAEADLLVEKSAASAFFPGRSPLPDLLAERGIDTVVVTGTVTNVCCESSARDASTLGYRVILVADATAAGSDAVHNATLTSVYRSFGDVRSTAEIVAMAAQEPRSRRGPGRGQYSGGGFGG